MTWTAERKYEAAVRAPMDLPFGRPDTRVVVRPGWYQVATPSAPGAILNEVIYSQVAAEDADRTIEEVIASCFAGGHPVKWCVGPWTRPDDFGDRLRRRGFSSWDVRGMATETARAIATPGEVAVEEVEEENLREYVEASARGWSLPSDQIDPDIEAHLGAMRAGSAHFFAARIQGEVAGTTGLFIKRDHAYLVGAQVFARFRGQGIYRALVAARLTFLARRGIALAVTHAREATSAPILEHLGFETVFRSSCFLLEPPRTAV